MLKRWNFLISDFYCPGVLGVVVVVIPRMALIWLMIMSLIRPMRRSSTRPLSTISPASVSSAGTGLANAREQRRKQTRRVLIIFSGGQVDWGVTAGSSFISRLCPQLPP